MSLRHLRKLEQLHEHALTHADAPTPSGAKQKAARPSKKGPRRVIVIHQTQTQTQTQTKSMNDHERDREDHNQDKDANDHDDESAETSQDEDVESQNASAPSARKTVPFNPFALLQNDQDDEDDDDSSGNQEKDDDDEDENEEPDNDEDGDGECIQQNPVAKHQSHGSNTNKSKKKQTKASAPKVEASSSQKQANAKSLKKGKKGTKAKENATAPNQNRINDDEEFEELLRSHVQEAKSSEEAHLLQTDKRFFNYQSEMKRMFGAGVVKEEMKRKQQNASRHMATAVHKKCALVHPNPIWPRWNGGISMELTKSENGINWFKFKYSREYAISEEHFEACRLSYDPNRLVLLIQNYPYQINGLYNLSEYFRLSGDMVQSAELIEMTLYAWECAFHPSFNPFSGSSRLDFSLAENELFLNCIFRHMQSLGRKGCARTTLEFCKFILSLDPERDPCKILLCIDYYSLRCREYAYLFRFYDQFGGWIELLPNFAFTVPLALHLWQTTGDSSSKGVVSPQTIGDKTPQYLIRDAILTFPWVVTEILAKGNVSTSVRGRDGVAWKDLLSHKLFKRGQPEILKTLVDVFVERGHTMWKSDDCQDFLKDGVKSAIQAFENGEPEVAQCQLKADRFKSDGLLQGLYKRVVLSDFSDTQQTIPAENLHGGGPGGAQIPQDDPRNALDMQANPLQLFLSSLLPWMHAPSHGQRRPAEDSDDE